MIFAPRDLTALTTPDEPLVEWEEVNCLLCGSGRWTTLVEAPDRSPGGSGLWFAVVQCQECGLSFTNPRPNQRTMPRFYSPAYGPHRQRFHPRPAVHRPLWLRSWRRRPIDRPAPPWHGPGRLLDFGCGSGAFLQKMHQEGWQVTGLDFSATAVERIRTEKGLPVLTGTLPHPDLQPATFDCITMRQALEHVPDPLLLLREAYELLVPGGTLLIGVPNLASLPFRWFAQAWFGLDLPRHLTHFTPTTLQLMLERAGFRAGKVRMMSHGKWLRASARLACADRHAPRWSCWLAHRTLARLAAWGCTLLKRSDCIWVTAEK